MSSFGSGGGNESNPGNSVASTSRAARFMALLSVASGAEMSKSGNSGGGTLASSSDALAGTAISGSGTDSGKKNIKNKIEIIGSAVFQAVVIRHLTDI